MLETLKRLLADQYEAAFCTLGTCIDRCPDEAWDGPVVNMQFCQVAFHTLFFADYYTGRDADALRRQPFHLENQAFFQDYEELEDRPQTLLYDRPSIRRYLEHCRRKAAAVIAEESADTLQAHCGFERLAFSRAELHVYNIRHIQHHAAQLSLRLRMDFQEDVPWIKSGWRDRQAARPT